MRQSRPRLRVLLLTAAAAALLAAAPARAASDPTDPWEPMNRAFFNFQETLDRSFISHLAHGFGKTPLPFRAGLVNFGHNLGEPTTFVNDLLQVRPGLAAQTLARFIVNSTIGIGGLFDVAGHNHLPRHDNGFGTTLGRWGFKPGPYLFIPFMGPSTFRDSLGDVADIGLNPMTYTRYPHKAIIGITTSVINGLSERLGAESQLDSIRQTSTDPYASLRSYFLQNRQSEITGKPVTIENLPSFDEPEPAKPAPGATPAPGTPSEPPKPEASPSPGAAVAATGTAASASACAPATERWADADAPYATWRGG
jgi:phospholipid-binding lipoprotein MlaA